MTADANVRAVAAETCTVMKTTHFKRDIEMVVILENGCSAQSRLIRDSIIYPYFDENGNEIRPGLPSELDKDDIYSNSRNEI